LDKKEVGMERLWAGALLAYRITDKNNHDITCHLVIISAETEALANEDARVFLHIKCPLEDGWKGHTWKVQETICRYCIEEREKAEAEANMSP